MLTLPFPYTHNGRHTTLKYGNDVTAHCISLFYFPIPEPCPTQVKIYADIFGIFYCPPSTQRWILCSIILDFCWQDLVHFILDHCKMSLEVCLFYFKEHNLAPNYTFPDTIWSSLGHWAGQAWIIRATVAVSALPNSDPSALQSI